MKRRSLSVPEPVESVIEALVSASGSSEDVPVLSKAAVDRMLLRHACKDLLEGDLELDGDVEDHIGSEELRELVPEHRRARYLYNEIKDENWVADMRGGFEGRLRDQLRSRFKNGYPPEDIREWSEGKKREAHLWFGAFGAEGDDREPEEIIEWIEDRIDDYAEKYETSEFDPDESFLDGFEGVEEATDRNVIDAARESGLLDELTELADDRLEPDYTATADKGPNPEARDPEAIARAIAKERGVKEEVAVEAVERASESRSPAVADGGSTEQEPDYNDESSN